MSIHFTKKAQDALNLSMQYAAELGHTYIGSEHLLLGLLGEASGVAAHYLTEKGATVEKIQSAIIRIAGKGTHTNLSGVDMTPRTKSIIENSLSCAQTYGQGYIGTEHLLLSLLEERDCVAVKILEELELPTADLRRDLVEFLSQSGQAPDVGESVRTSSAGKGSGAKNVKSSLDSAPTLKSYGKDLTAYAKAGKIDPIIGRDNETERVIQILSRRNKNNPCLIGEPGVGKTAVVEGLAQRIVNGNVPENLKDRIIITLDIAAMIAGAKYRGEFEERFKNVMEEVRKNPNLILFIDEIHTIIGAGAAEGAVDAANIIKPALARSEMQVIGATTISEYRKHIEKDAALERRFQPVTVREPSSEEALQILHGLREKYEAHHKLKISDKALEAAVRLSVRYIADRYLPDKAIDLIDEAASRLRISAHTSPDHLKTMEEKLKQLSADKESAIAAQEFETAARLRDEEQALREEYETKKAEWKTHNETAELTVSDTDIADVVTQWTGIPVNRLLEEESDKLIKLGELLGQSYINFTFYPPDS